VIAEGATAASPPNVAGVPRRESLDFAKTRPFPPIGKATSEQDLGPGRTLDPNVRRYFEPRFGFDLANVRVHDDGAAHARAVALSADAFAVGNHIVFAQGKSDFGTPAGSRLLAHELAHVGQQSRAAVAVRQCKEAATPSSTAEAVARIRDLIEEYQKTTDSDQRTTIANRILDKIHSSDVDAGLDPETRVALRAAEAKLQKALRGSKKSSGKRAAAAAGTIVLAGGGPEDLPADALAVIVAVGILIVAQLSNPNKVDPEKVQEALDRIRELLRQRQQEPARDPEPKLQEPARDPEPKLQEPARDPEPKLPRRTIDIIPPEEDEPKIELAYRGMKDDGGAPAVEQSARGLGVRELDDKLDIIDGLVQPTGKGMSLAPDTPMNLPEIRRGPDWNGKGKDPVWGIPTSAFQGPLLYFRDRIDHANAAARFAH
jgi:hypothetical protein